MLGAGGGVEAVDLRPHRLVSFWDMLIGSALAFHIALEELEMVSSYPQAGDTQVQEPELATIRKSFDRARRMIAPVGFTPQAEALDRIVANLESGATYGELRTLTEDLLTSLKTRLSDHFVLFVTAAGQPYYDKDKLFGDAVDEKFPSASRDIHRASNCYALTEHTACVFHLMRVIERGLRGLARKLKVKLRHSVELEDWGQILTAIDVKLKTLNNQKRTRSREDDLEFFSTVRHEFGYFKNVWRDHVSHTRGDYDEQQALSALNHVKAFMQKLSERVGEVHEN